MSTKGKQKPRPTIAVSAVIFDSDERVLLVQRGQPPAMNQWHVPGGKIEAGESLVEACRREINEETGIDGILIGPIIAVVERRLRDFHYIIIDFLATLSAGGVPDPMPSDDVTDAKWIGLQHLEQFDLADGLRPILQIAHSNLLTKSQSGLFDYDGSATDFLPLTLL